MPPASTGAHPEVTSGPHRLVYVLLTVIGLVLIALGAHSRFTASQTWFPELCIALGVAVTAPGILSYLYRKYLVDEITVELSKPAREFQEEATARVGSAIDTVVTRYRSEIQLLEKAKAAGLVGLYQSRHNALANFLDYISEEQDQIDIVGSSLRGLLQDSERAYEDARRLLRERMQSGVRLRLLLTHPIVADLRARQENRRFQDIGQEILLSLEILLTEWGVAPEHIKLYEGTPTHFGLRTGTAMVINGYPYMREAFASPCLIVLKDGYFYEHFATSHFAAWNTSLALPIPSELQVLRSALSEYADHIRGLMETAHRPQSSNTH